MLSKIIVSDPYFHNNHDEKSAKETLNNAVQENFLFCPGKKENDIVLVYKAEFNGEKQVRTINLNYYENDGSINHNSLGSHATLHSVSQSLIKFLTGWTSKAFAPVPFIKPPIVALTQKEDFYINPIPNNVVEKQIFTLFNKKSMATLVQVCKSWYQLGTKCQFQIEAQEFAQQQEERMTNNAKIKFIFEIIREKITPEREGVKNPYKILAYNGSTISEPMEYGCQIICAIKTPTNLKDRHVFIHKNESSIRLTGSSELLTNDEIQLLEDVCLYGKNPYKEFTEEENDNLAINGL